MALLPVYLNPGANMTMTLGITELTEHAACLRVHLLADT